MEYDAVVDDATMTTAPAAAAAAATTTTAAMTNDVAAVPQTDDTPRDAAAGAADAMTTTTAATTAHAAATMYDSLYQLRRVRRARTQYEKLQRPPHIAPGEPVPSIEGWVLFLRGLPPTSTVEDVQQLFVGFRAGDPDYFGVIREVKLPLDKDCLCSGYALVELESHAGYVRALRELDDTPVTYAAAPAAPGDGDDADKPDDATLPRLRVSSAFLAEEDDDDDDRHDDAVATTTTTTFVAPGEKRVRDGGLATRNDDNDGGSARSALESHADTYY